MKKEKRTNSHAPEYNMLQNSWYMITLAWTSGEKKVIVLGLLSAILTVSSSLVNLYVVPVILQAVERHVSAPELMLTILGFVLAMMILSASCAYVKENILFGRIAVRTRLVHLLNQKALTTSYPNLDNDVFQKLLAKSGESVQGNDQSTEAVWTTLTDLTADLLGFVICISLFTVIRSAPYCFSSFFPPRRSVISSAIG